MKSVRAHDYGLAPCIDDIKVPAIGAEDVLVRVKAASLNPLDVKMHSGALKTFFPLSFPYTLATDLAGTVERVGSGAAQWRQGAPVFARVDPTSGGALAEFAVVPAAYLAAAPANISLEQAAGVPTAAGTAWQALFEAATLSRGQTVLIHAGAGGVGSFAIQLAKVAGARVIATASGSGIDIARQLGADQVIDYRSENFWDSLSNVDVVLDTIGGETQQRSFGVLRSGGALIATVSPPDQAAAKAHNVAATFVFHNSDATRLKRLAEQIDTGALKVLVDRTVQLEAFGEALGRQASGHARGKIIVRVG